MNGTALACTKCSAELPPDLFNLPGWVQCPACGEGLQIEVFPALFRPPTVGAVGELQLEDKAAVCFYHAHKKAVIPCDACGRFLCALCDCEHEGQHICPACLETGRTKGKIKSLENRRMCYDSLALTLALAPMILFYFTVITAPLALFIAIRHWNSPTSILRRGKTRLVAAIAIASLQMAGWIFFFIWLFAFSH